MIKKFESFKESKVDIEYYDNGQKKIEDWILNNNFHREDGPARQRWYENGQKRIESWYLNGESHREDGPSYQYWHENGQKRVEIWHLNNDYYEREEWIEKLKEIGSKHYEEQKMLFDIEKYNL